MDKSTAVVLANVEGYEGRRNDLIFCGSEGQQHVVFFPGDIQVRMFIKTLLNNTFKIDRYKRITSSKLCFKFTLIRMSYSTI